MQSFFNMENYIISAVLTSAPQNYKFDFWGIDLYTDPPWD